MSTPISVCLVSKACLGDEQAFAFLVKATEYNRAWGAYTIFPCECSPPCQKPSKEQVEAFNTRLEAELKRRRAERAKTARPVGNFEKFIFPVIKNMPDLKISDMFGPEQKS